VGHIIAAYLQVLVLSIFTAKEAGATSQKRIKKIRKINNLYLFLVLTFLV
jgi:hypothetical protein